MADQGLLAQAKPAGTTNTVLYAAPIDASASAILNIANDGSASQWDLALKDYDQKLTLDASTYALHKGDIVSGYRVNLNTPVPAAATLAGSTLLTSTTGEKSFKFESYYIAPYTEIFVKTFAIRQITLESVSGTPAVGETIVKGSGGNTATATIYAAAVGSGTTNVYIGPTTLAGSVAEFVAGDSVTASGGATGTIASGGVGTANNEFAFSVTTAGGTYDLYLGTNFTVFGDRAYRFNVADASMSGRDFHISTTVNGEWGPDGTFVNSDDGTEYTTGKTTNGTAGSSGAYVQYDLSANSSLSSSYYYYDGGTGTAANANYGGSDRLLTTSTEYSYDSLYVYDIEGDWSGGSDQFTHSGTTYTVSSVTAGPYGYIRSYSGTTAYVVKGTNSADFAGTNTFRDNPKVGSTTRNTVTVSSVGVATTAVENENYLYINQDNAANNVIKITSLVIGPGERLVIESNSQNNAFSLIGFEDTSTSFVTRVFDPAATVGGGGSG